MSSNRERRINAERKADGLFGCGEYADTGIKVEPIPGEEFQFKGTLVGPSETPYEGGTFVVHIIIPKEYAFPTFYLSFIIPPPEVTRTSPPR